MSWVLAKSQGSTSCMILTLASHPLTLAECSCCLVTRPPPTQASWSLADCGQRLFITSLSGGQLSQTLMVLACSSLMGSWYFWMKMSFFYLTHCDTSLTNSTINWHFSNCNISHFVILINRYGMSDMHLSQFVGLEFGCSVIECHISLPWLTGQHLVM